MSFLDPLEGTETSLTSSLASLEKLDVVLFPLDITH